MRTLTPNTTEARFWRFLLHGFIYNFFSPRGTAAAKKCCTKHPTVPSVAAQPRISCPVKVTANVSFRVSPGLSWTWNTLGLGVFGDRKARWQDNKSCDTDTRTPFKGLDLWTDVYRLRAGGRVLTWTRTHSHTHTPLFSCRKRTEPENHGVTRGAMTWNRASYTHTGTLTRSSSAQGHTHTAGERLHTHTHTHTHTWPLDETLTTCSENPAQSITHNTPASSG